MGILTAHALGYDQNFNWIWLVELIVSCILVLFFLFYFNRLFATLVSYGLRAYTWHKFRVYIDIQALQISFLGGRLFFKGLRYHGENETILVQHGYLTWRYWLRSARQVDLARHEISKNSGAKRKSVGLENKSEASGTSESDEEVGAVKKVDNAEARIALSISGLEWFIYNNAPAYNAIAGEEAGDHEENGHVDASENECDFDRHSSQLKHDRSNGEDTPGDFLSSGDAVHLQSQKENKGLNSSSVGAGLGPLHHAETWSTVASSRHESPTTSDPPQSLLLGLLPISIECQKGAISMGNEHTKAILTTTFVKARGHIDATRAGPLDLFRQLFDFEIEHPVVQMRPNPDFRQSQRSAAERIISAAEFVTRKKRWWSIDLQFHRRRRKLWHDLRNLVPVFRSSVESLHASGINDKAHFHEGNRQETESEEGHWVGLSRYLDYDDHAGWAHIDYARFSTVLDCPSIHLTFYWDTPGPVVGETDAYSALTTDEDINGSEPPAYGLDLSIRGGSIDYGPWTDRLRVEIQNAFFPNAYRSATPAQRLQNGSMRRSTAMTIRVDIEKEVSLRVPTRESSKDWQWKGRATALRNAATMKKQRGKRHFRFRKAQKSSLAPDVRPFGWLTISVSPDSTVRYEMGLMARNDGYHNLLKLDLKGTKATSSVNHALLWRCKEQRLSCDLRNPLGWNSLHTWIFDVHNEDMELFLLRDHMFLLTDLIGDFTSGPKPEYMTFVPFQYHMGLVFANLKLYLNANDSNIIDNPCDLDDNTFLVLEVQRLNGGVDIPSLKFSAIQNSVLFNAKGHCLSLKLRVPVWNTLHTFVNENSIAFLKDLDLSGSYNYYSATSPQLADSLFLDIDGMAPKFNLHGFLIRYFMNVKENYFGDFLHFKTIEEYQETLTPGDDFKFNQDRAPAKNENDLDVILTVKANRSCVLLPGNLYSRKENVRFEVLLIEADMRFTNYYMDLAVRSSPLEASLESTTSETDDTCKNLSSTQLFVDGVSIYGHRLFGAPPAEPTYVCNWDFGVGKITGECSSAFLRTLIFAIRAFTFTLDDDENALPVSHAPVIHDITFLRASVESVRLWLVSETAAMMLEISHAEVSLKDWAGPKFSQQVQASLPSIVLAAVDPKSAIRHHEGTGQRVSTIACFKTSIELKTVDKKADFARDRALQQQHVRFHDQRTHRTDWLLHDGGIGLPTKSQLEWIQKPLSMPIPTMPEPTIWTRERSSGLTQNGQRSTSHRQLHRRRSFLSLSSSASGRSDRGLFANSKRNQALWGQERQSSSKNRSAAEGSRLDSKLIPDYVTVNRNDKEVISATTNARFSSPWLQPHFSLENVKPDTREIPLVPTSIHRASSRKINSDTDEIKRTYTEDSNIAHIGILCNLSTGLVGFCTPKFFTATCQLLEDLKPKHPVDILDAIQTDTMSEVAKATNTESKPSQINDVALEIPFLHVRIINTGISDEDATALQIRDQYDAIISEARVSCRIQNMMKKVAEEPRETPGLTIHTLASKIVVSVSAKEESQDKATTQVTFSDLGFWLSAQESIKGKLQLRSVDVVGQGRRVAYVASLVHRTSAMVEDIVNNFQKLGQGQLVQHLIYHLTLVDARIADPIFLTRPSYVLRSAAHNLRLSDSWKILSRLRHIYRSLPTSSQIAMVEKSLGSDFDIPQDAKNCVLAVFDQWRNWDHDRTESLPIMDKIFGGSVSPSQSAQTSTPFNGEVSIQNTAVTFDPGPSQSDFILGDLNVGISVDTVYPKKDRLFPQGSNQVRKIGVQSYFSESSLNINWEIVEFVFDVLEQFQQPGHSLPSEPTKHPANSPQLTSHSDIFVVFGTDKASVNVHSINLSLNLAAERLKGSLLHSKTVLSQTNSSLMLSCATASAKVKSQTRMLLGWRLYLPNVYTSLLSHPHTLSIAATCQKLRFDLKEDILGVLNVVHRVIDDELRLVDELIGRLGNPPTRSEKGSDKTQQPIDLHIAMFLDDYKLKFAILPSFSYTIAGEVARTSIIPRKTSKLSVDFDLKGHNHSFRASGDQQQNAVPVLNMPPINGRISMSFSQAATNVAAQTTIEQINFEASALRACVDAVNRPEVARIIVDAKASFDRAMSKLDVLFSPSPNLQADDSPKSTSQLRYSAHTTLAGLKVLCSAPAIKSQDYRADLDLSLGLTTLAVHNRTDQVDFVHERPQFEVNLRHIAVGIRKITQHEDINYGRFGISMKATGRTEMDGDGHKVQVYHASSEGLSIDLYEQTAPLVVDVTTFLQERLQSLRLTDEARNFRPLRRLTLAGLDERPVANIEESNNHEQPSSSSLFDSVYSLDLNDIQARWILPEQSLLSPGREPEDLVFSIQKIDLKTRREGSARLAIMNLQLQMVPKSLDPLQRTSNSALLPEAIFNAAYLSINQGHKLAFQAAGKVLDLRLASDFAIPASLLQKSLGTASADLRQASASRPSRPSSAPKETTNILGNKRLASVLVHADFAGAVVNLKARKREDTPTSVFGFLKGKKRSRASRYGQVVQGDTPGEATLRAPGIALKVEYNDNGTDDPVLSVEMKVAASSNVLYPSVVPLVQEISSSVKEIIGDPEQVKQPPNEKPQAQVDLPETTLRSDPVAILGRCKLNAGLWIQRQEFSLSCQPIARVAATARFDDIFMTINTVQTQDQDRFFALLTTFNNLQASVQHVYSRESTASFEVESIAISMMNSKHVSTAAGVSVILKISPMKTNVNAKQLQDFLLFREIWYPTDARQVPPTNANPAPVPDTQSNTVQRYQQVAAAGTFTWHAVISLQELKVQLDLGPGLGKCVFTISKLWVSSKKDSDLESNLCAGFEKVGVESSGRMSGFIELQDFRVRTSIQWPAHVETIKQTPLVQGSLGFGHLRVKAAFDYQPFAVADISSFEFLMYNVREYEKDGKDRLVGILDGGKVQLFCTTATAAQALALFQAFERLVQEKQTAYKASLKELDRYMRRKSVFPSSTWTATTADAAEEVGTPVDGTFSLHTDVVVNLKELNFGAFPSTFFDNQIFKVEANDAQARFAVSSRNEKIHSSLGLILGQLRVALSNVNRANTQALGEVSVADVISRATGSRGGTILKVPKLVATMQTWQTASSNVIEYIFKSTFEGKVDVGWNYSRISFIRGMWSAHTRALAHRLGKPLPQSAVKITTEPHSPDMDGSHQGQEKITAVVNVPQSRFEYVSIEPPIIDTPQLRDMGEATPPLEWIGLHRERLPNLTHQLIIVTLLEVARKVEDAYSRILGSS